MTQEDKNLLIKDLCMRLLYGIKVQYNNEIYNIDYISALYEEVKLDIPDNYTVGISDIKPYLRPMSSMTEEYELQEIIGKDVEIPDDFIHIVDSSRKKFSFLELQAVFDYLLKHHFDYLGLIPKGLAIEITEENNPYK